MLVVLDRGHGQKAKGAAFDPGATYGRLREVDLVEGYIERAAEVLRAAGHRVELLDSGTYDERHRAAIKMAATEPEALYVQCHVNAGGGKYGVVEHDARSRAGRRAAAFVADAMDELPETRKVYIWDLDPTERGWSCIDGIWESPSMCGLLFEPGFIDAKEHAHLWDAAGLVRVGNALAAGILAYASSVDVKRAA